MSKITNDAQPGLTQDALQLYAYGNSERQTIKESQNTAGLYSFCVV